MDALGSSGAGDAPGSDAAEFLGELLLELQAYVGRAAQRVGHLVQDGPGEGRQGLELSALDDDPPEAPQPARRGR